MGFVYDTSKKGIEIVMRDYQAMVMGFLWERGEDGSDSRSAWIHVSKILREKERTISRASIIFFMNDMVDEGVLKFREKSGKGGYHRIYIRVYNEEKFKEYLVKQIMNKLFEEFPEETSKVLSSGLSGPL